MATILIVEDEPAGREYLMTLLGHGGHRLLQATDGAEGLAIIRAEHPDLVITDTLMPTMDGYEFVRQLRADPAIAGTPLIFCTAHYHEREARHLADACGVAHVLTKPCEPEVVLRTVDAALGVAPPPAPAPPAEEFDPEHMRLLTDRLSRQTNELSQANERLSALIDLSLQLGSELNPRRLLKTFCHAARRIIGARYAMTGILDDSGLGLRYLFTSGMDAETAARLGSPEPKQGALKAVLGEARCFRLSNAGGDPVGAGFSSSYPPIHSWLGAPVVSPTRVYGWLGLIDKVGADAFSDEDERLVRILAAQVGRTYQNGSLYADVLRHAAELEREVGECKRAEAERGRLYQELAAGRESLQVLSRHLIETQEKERRNLARELHDEIGQVLTAVNLNLEALRPSIAPAAVGGLEESLHVVNRAIEQVRNLSLDLRPAALDLLGLDIALRTYLSRQAARAGLALEFTSSLAGQRLPPTLETACFRVVQEATTNVLRHARAAHCRIELALGGGEMQITIRDDGAGFDVAAARERALRGQGFGLLSMLERVQLFGGRIDIDSAPGRGTTVRARFPVPGTPAEAPGEAGR